MPPQQEETPPKSSRGSRRRPRKSAHSTPSYIPSDQNNTDLEDPALPRDSEQPTRILRRTDYDVAPDVNVVGNLQLPNPTTPPRPRSMYDGYPNAQHQGHQSAPDVSQRRKRGRKSHGGITRASGVSKSESNEAPLPAPTQQFSTPSRHNVTPVKAYAGPTFHASPAPSSLPIPKFLSRSVPNVDKTLSLKNMMEQEVADTTSESDNSPFLEKSRPTQDRQVREESPLDIFFQADRDAKAKAKAKTQSGSTVVFHDLEGEMKNDVRHHSRHPTDGSLNGMFPLEMDGAATETCNRKDTDKEVTPTPKVMTEANHQDEQRKAQTLELKKLLYSPMPQRSGSASPYTGTPPKGLGSPSPKIIPREGAPGIVSDSTSKDQQRHAALLALAQKQISGIGTSIGSTPQRPPSSKLREEMSVPISPGVQPPELPATPTQSRVQSVPTLTNGHTQQQQKGYTSPYSPFSSAFTPAVKSPGGYKGSPSRNSRDSKSMEDDLRRILKLDILGNDSVTDVRS